MTNATRAGVPCDFCWALDSRPIVGENEHALAFYDRYPVAPGHVLVVPKRHVMSVFSLPPDEFQALWSLLGESRAVLDAQFRPDAFNVGVNDGKAAGQTIEHAHVHLIPRFTGDVPDPRGGCRWVLPERADYWTGADTDF